MTTALVTGATRGLGRALAFDLARSGMTVLGTALDPNRLSALARDAGDLPIEALRSDITEPADNTALAGRLAETGLGVLIHNAGILGPRVGLEDYPLSTFQQVLNVNTTGPFDLTARVAPHLRPGATVIFLSSGVGVVGRANGAPTASQSGASKASHGSGPRNFEIVRSRSSWWTRGPCGPRCGPRCGPQPTRRRIPRPWSGPKTTWPCFGG